MSDPVRTKPTAQPKVKNTPSTQPKLDPAAVAAALGAVPTGVTVTGGSPMTKFAARREAYRHLAGGSVAAGGEVWAKLAALAAAAVRPDAPRSPERVGQLLLAWAVEQVEKGNGPEALRKPAADAPPAAG